MNTHSAITRSGRIIGKNTFHLADLDKRGAIVTRTKVSRNQLVGRFQGLARSCNDPDHCREFLRHEGGREEEACLRMR
jgi:hypothetical protein